MIRNLLLGFMCLLSYTCMAFTPPTESVSKDYVDLGLSSGTLWATCNIGASAPEEAGSYYSWGETQVKQDYSSKNYTLAGKDLGDCISGTNYDAAFVSSNGKWRMPTKEEAEELINECKWEKSKLNNVTGYYIQGKNGNKIFMPCVGGSTNTGSGYYWTGTSSKNSAVRLDLNYNEVYLYNGARFDGRHIRPVLTQKKEPNTPSNVEGFIDLNLPSGKLWAEKNVNATKIEDYGTYYDWTDLDKKDWGNDAYVPSKADRDELVAYCTYSLDEVNGIKGARYTARNGNSIFFPFAGYNNGIAAGTEGQYWTTTPYEGQGEYNCNPHWILATDHEKQDDNWAYFWPNDYFSFPIRLVHNGTSTPIHLPTSIKSPKQSKKVLKNKMIIIQKANEEYMTNGIKLAQ